MARKFSELRKKMSPARQARAKEHAAEIRRGIACVEHGHPRIVNVFFGEVTCARCGEIVGDTLTRNTDLSRHVVVGHDCPDCRENARQLTVRERRHLPPAVRAEIQKMRDAAQQTAKAAGEAR